MVKKPWSRSLCSFSGPGAPPGHTWAPVPLQLLGMLCFLTPLPAFQMNSGALLQPLLTVMSNSASEVSVWCVYIFKDKIINANKLSNMWIFKTRLQNVWNYEYYVTEIWQTIQDHYHCIDFVFCWREGIFI